MKTTLGGEGPTDAAHQAHDALGNGRDVHDLLNEYGRQGSADVDIEPRAVDVTIDEAINDWHRILCRDDHEGSGSGIVWPLIVTAAT